MLFRLVTEAGYQPASVSPSCTGQGPPYGVNPPVCSARSRPAQAPKSNSNPSLTRRGMRPSLVVSPTRSSYCIDQAGRTCDTYRSIPSYVGRIHPSRGVILAASPPRGTSADSRFQVLMLPLQHADDREDAPSPQTDFQYLN